MEIKIRQKNISNHLVKPEQEDNHRKFFLAKILDVIDKNYMQEDFNVNDLANRLGKNRSHISRIFSMEMNISIKDYIKGKKIERSCH